MRYGFVIDQNRCIGCHACTLACKEENGVPLGVFRTWVKYIEKGTFPHTKRHFAVMRCNHCDEAPCVAICPTSALFRRSDGIVDFDNSRCIGCKSCMQACPYDALYLDPSTHTAAKCNFCAHRIEMQLEPACVVVCPVQAIIAGDIDDPGSHISQVIASAKVTARKPQKGTRPKLFYVGVDGDLTQPSMTEAAPNYMFAERYCSSTNLLGDKTAAPALTLTCTDGDRSNPGAARVVYDVAHPQPWAWIPAFYLWTKSIGAGVLMVAALFLGLVAPFEAGSSQFLFRVTVPGTALLFTGLTALLLIADLHRPDRFYYILFKPNLRSWLVLGTWILIIYSILAAIWLIHGVVVDDLLPPLLVVMTAIAAGCSAGYSAFLFAQAKGRDLWQSPVFLWHLLVQAIMAGAAAMIILAVLAGYPHIPKMLDGGRETVRFSNFVLVVAITLSILMIFGELTMTPVSVDVRYASEVILRGRLRALFWLGVVGLGTILPAGILSYIFATADTSRSLEIPAAVASLAGLLMFEKVWIDAGQAPPLS